VVALDTIVRVLLGVVEYGEKQLLDHMLPGQSPVGDDIVRLTILGWSPSLDGRNSLLSDAPDPT
jgi:hypothetical protein